MCVFFFKQKTAYEMRISDWSSDVCSSDLQRFRPELAQLHRALLRDHDPDQETHQSDDAERGHAYHLEPMDRRVETKTTRVAQHVPERDRRRAEEAEQAVERRQADDDGIADQIGRAHV